MLSVSVCKHGLVKVLSTFFLLQLYVSNQFLQPSSGRIRSSGPQTASDDDTRADVSKQNQTNQIWPKSEHNSDQMRVSNFVQLCLQPCFFCRVMKTLCSGLPGSVSTHTQLVRNIWWVQAYKCHNTPSPPPPDTEASSHTCNVTATWRIQYKCWHFTWLYTIQIWTCGFILVTRLKSNVNHRSVSAGCINMKLLEMLNYRTCLFVTETHVCQHREVTMCRRCVLNCSSVLWCPRRKINSCHLWKQWREEPTFRYNEDIWNHLKVWKLLWWLLLYISRAIYSIITFSLTHVEH